MLDWVIVGGGIHGTLIARALVDQGACDTDRVRVLDPHPEPLQRWRECTENSGMEFLRSSVVHHLDRDPLSLDRFAAEAGAGECDFQGPYKRPRLSLFSSHCAAVMDRIDMRSMRVRGRVSDLRRIAGGVEVDTEAGVLQARRAILAIGASEQPMWPDWALRLRRDGARVHHLFGPGFSLRELAEWHRLLVVGGGISALQAAEALAADSPAAVTVVSRHALRVFDFDTDSTWLGPRRARSFERLRTPAQRRRAIAAARHRGSAPPDVVERFSAARERHELQFIRASIVAARRQPSGVVVDLEDGRTTAADVVILATGFDPRRPGGPWLDSVIDRLGLECAPCGYPIVDQDLRWDNSIFVTGPLAELQLGPTARNIHGARQAGRKFAEIARN